MPFVRIFLRPGTTPEYRQALGDGVHRALVESIAIPPDDRFLVISEHAGSDLTFDPQYLGVQRSDRFVLVQITLSVGRKPQQKRRLFKRIAEILGESPGAAAAGPHDRAGGDGLGKLVIRKRRSPIHGQLIATLQQRV